MPPATLTMTYEERRRAVGAEISRYRGWYIFESILFILMGLAAVALPGVTTLAVDGIVGALLLLAGAMRIANGLRFSRGRGWRLISGAIFAAAGGTMLFWPLAGIAAISTVLGVLLLAEGMFDILMALAYRPAFRWGALLLSGIVSLFLGFFIFAGFPVSGMIFLAIAIGVSMLFYGFSLLMLALGVAQ
jgi:uncharacterized membrane protein HdeD (DUF308 family)